MRTGTATPLTVSSESAHASALRRLIRGEVRFGRHDRMLYATDASIYQVEPLGVVIPADADDLAEAARYCCDARLAMLPRGGGTSLAGQCVNEAVVFDCSAGLRSVLEVDGAARTCRVEAGVPIADLNDHLAPHGLFFAPDPSTVKQANMGGCIGNNAAGTRSIRYGRTAENLLGVDVITADGTRLRLDRGAGARSEQARSLTRPIIDLVRTHREEIRARFPKTTRRNAGYALDMVLDQVEEAERTGVDPLETVNLAHLICGSEGTLAFIESAELKLFPRPERFGLVVIGFSSLEHAIELVPELVRIAPSAVELLDDLVITTGRLNAQSRPMVERLPQPPEGELQAVLYVEFSEAKNEDGVIEAGFEAVRRVLGAHADRVSAVYLTDPAVISEALALRRAGEPLLHAIPGSRKPLGFIEDNAVPVERLGEFVARLRAIIAEHGTRAAFYAHASVGVLHVRPLLDLHDPEDEPRMHDIAARAAALAQELGGVMSGEHGDGRARGPFVDDYFGPTLMQAFREVKQLFDPHHLLNPGNIVTPGAVESISEHTRIKPHEERVHPVEFETRFDYAHVGGFAHAVEACNGSGVCRKSKGGVMCPSYMATLDERHSTRGRGNALRLALTGQLSDDGSASFDDPETNETLRLCLSCKACKSECPTNVDVGTYKAEYTAKSFEQRGRPTLQAFAFGHVRTLNRMGSLLAPVSNSLARLPVNKWILEKVLGVSPKRSLPAFEKSLFGRARAAERSGGINAAIATGAPCVVIFGDCFTAYNEPSLGLSAAKLLNGFGYRVRFVDAGCCGRAAVSTGLLNAAKGMIGSTVERVREIVERESAEAVLFLEPSCQSAAVDEWLSLKHGSRETARALHPLVRSVEEFLAERWDEHPRRPEPIRHNGPVMLHGHCHQKALWTTGAAKDLFERMAPAVQLEVLDSTCCGMAGSFGYTTDRYELSVKIGELSVLPAARRANETGAVMLAPGTSCRHQIDECAGIKPTTPIEWLAHAILERES